MTAQSWLVSYLASLAELWIIRQQADLIYSMMCVAYVSFQSEELCSKIGKQDGSETCRRMYSTTAPSADIMAKLG